MNIKKILPLLIMCLAFTAQAQVKIATVNVKTVFDALPESKQAAAKLQESSAKMKAEYEMMQSDFNRKYAAYQAIAADYATPQTIKDRRVREIQDYDKEISNFLANSDKALAEQKETLEAPIYAKIYAAIKQIGDREGYTYIFDTSATPLAYSGADATDLTQLVITALQ